MMIAATGYTSTTDTAARRTGTAGASAAGFTADAQAEPRKMPIVVFNPRSHFDSEAGVFVMEFRSTRTGEIERRFPDEQQLKAYRQAAAERRNDTPAAAVTV